MEGKVGNEGLFGGGQEEALGDGVKEDYNRALVVRLMRVRVVYKCCNQVCMLLGQECSGRYFSEGVI